MNINDGLVLITQYGKGIIFKFNHSDAKLFVALEPMKGQVQPIDW
jgi:hypothetical protein